MDLTTTYILDKYLFFRFNYPHHAKIRHCLKSRAAKYIILYNRIMDETTSSSSQTIDL